MPESTNYPNASHLTVDDPKRSIRFYKKLGFELESTWPNAKQPQHASLVLDKQVVMLGASLSEKQGKQMGASKAVLRRIKKDHKAFKKHPAGVGVHVYLHVPDVDAHHKRAVRGKVDVLLPPTTHFYGIRDYVAADPDGYRLVFFSPAEVTAELTPAPRRKTRKKAAAPSKTAEPSAEPALQ